MGGGLALIGAILIGLYLLMFGNNNKTYNEYAKYEKKDNELHHYNLDRQRELQYEVRKTHVNSEGKWYHEVSEERNINYNIARDIELAKRCMAEGFEFNPMHGIYSVGRDYDPVKKEFRCAWYAAEKYRKLINMLIANPNSKAPSSW